MNLRTVVSLVVSTAMLAACSGGDSSGNIPASHPASTTARGTLVITESRGRQIPQGHGRKPAYVSIATTNANLFIDGAGPQIATCTGPAPPTCTISWTATAGTHTFAAEIDDGLDVLAEGSQSETLVSGDNGALVPMTLNGAPAYATFTGTAAGTTVTGTFQISDADSYVIDSPGTYDGYSVSTTLTFPSNAPSVGTVTTPSSLYEPDNLSLGDANYNYPYTATCIAGTGTFAPQRTSPNPAELTNAQLQSIPAYYTAQNMAANYPQNILYYPGMDSIGSFSCASNGTITLL